MLPVIVAAHTINGEKTFQSKYHTVKILNITTIKISAVMCMLRFTVAVAFIPLPTAMHYIHKISLFDVLFCFISKKINFS